MCRLARARCTNIRDDMVGNRVNIFSTQLYFISTRFVFQLYTSSGVLPAGCTRYSYITRDARGNYFSALKHFFFSSFRSLTSSQYTAANARDVRKQYTLYSIMYSCVTLKPGRACALVHIILYYTCMTSEFFFFFVNFNVIVEESGFSKTAQLPLRPEGRGSNDANRRSVGQKLACYRLLVVIVRRTRATEPTDRVVCPFTLSRPSVPSKSFETGIANRAATHYHLFRDPPVSTTLNEFPMLYIMQVCDGKHMIINKLLIKYNMSSGRFLLILWELESKYYDYY